MMKQLKKVLSILCAIALLISSMTFALAEDTDNEEAANITLQQTDDQPAADQPAADQPAEDPADDPAEVTDAADTAEAEDKDEEPEAPAAGAEEEDEEPEAPAADAEEEDEEPEAPAADAEDEDADPAEGEASDNNADEESDEDEESEEEGMYHLEDNDGYVDQEVIEENTPAITDELKGLRDAELYVDDTLDDTIRFCDELTVTLKGCDVSTVELQLYLPAGASMITKVDGKLVSFTPADSDVPSMKLFTYELTNAAGRDHKIVLSTYDEEVSFSLAAVVKQVEELTEEEPADAEETAPVSENNDETPAEQAAENNEAVPAEENTDVIPADETPADVTPVDEASDDETPVETENEEPAETPAPTVQASVKTYDALKVGSSISDTLIAAQKARIQVKCGKNPYVTLTLDADPDDVNVSIDGDAAQFTDEGDGTYTCDLDEVAFRKFTVVISAKQELSFTLTAEARQVEDAPVYDDDENNSEDEDITEEENNDNINKEETAEEPADEVTEETEETETAEEPSEDNAEETEEAETPEANEGEAVEETEAVEEDAGETEEASEEVTEETEEDANGETEEAESSEENEGEAVEGEEENKEVATEEATAEEAVTAEPLTDDQLIELGYRKVVVLNKNGADIYAGIEAEVVGHADFESELWIKDAEVEGWAEIYTEEEIKTYIKLAELDKQPLTEEEIEALGYRKIQILNKNGTDIYGSTEEEAAVIGHADFETEIWIKDLEAEGWAEIFSEEGTKQYVKLAELDKQPLTEEEIEALGYRKVQILNANGTDIYDSTEEEAAVIGRADFETEMWIKDLETEGWAEIYTEEEIQKFVKLAELDKQPLTDEEIEALGYRKVQILNQNGTDIYDSIEEEAAVIGHADFESEIWIKDLETEGWAEVYNEEGVQQFIKLAEIDKQMPSDEEMLEAGYIKVYVAIDIGANIYAGSEEYEEEEPIDHLDVGTGLWVKLIDDAERAQIYDMDEEAPVRYINLVDIIATLKPEGMEDLPTRELLIHSSLDDGFIVTLVVGVRVDLSAELINFKEDDQYEVCWQYSSDGQEFIDIPDAKELDFSYIVDMNNGNYIWKVIVKLISPKEELVADKA